MEIPQITKIDVSRTLQKQVVQEKCKIELSQKGHRKGHRPGMLLSEL